MDDFLSNPEERISSFQGTVEKALTEEKKTEETLCRMKKGKRTPIKKEDTDLKDKSTFSIRLSKTVELPIRKAILDIFETTGENISIQQFVSSAVLFYLENSKKK